MLLWVSILEFLWLSILILTLPHLYSYADDQYSVFIRFQKCIDCGALHKRPYKECTIYHHKVYIFNQDYVYVYGVVLMFFSCALDMQSSE